MSTSENQAQEVQEEKPKDESPIEVQKNSTPSSANIFEEIISLKDKKVFLISESFEEKIPQILSYLSDDISKAPIKNKIEIFKYLEDLFKNIDYNSEIFLNKNSNDKEKLNIFKVIIHEYVLNTEKGQDSQNEEEIKSYKEELKNIFSLLISKISFDKKDYHYIFSFMINYLNQKNNKIETNQKLNSEQISRILELLNLYYQSMQNTEEIYNYLYFNNSIKTENKSEYLINIPNKENLNRKKILTLDDSLNILLFIKLIPNEYIKIEDPEHSSELLEIVFADQTKNISFNIDNENNLINNISKEKIVKLEENKFINILFRLNLKDSLKFEIYKDNKKIDLKNDQIEIQENEKSKLKEKFDIKSINLFKNFIGNCYNIIIFKNKKIEGLPKFFLHLQNIEEKKAKSTNMSALFDTTTKNKNEKSAVKQELVFNPLYQAGICNENLFNILLKQELKDDAEQNNIDNVIYNKIQDKTPLADIKDLLDKILAIYLPSRYEIPSELGFKNVQNSPKIILKDSINNLDAIFIRNNSTENKVSNLNGIHLFNRLIDDLNIVGGLNHLIPILELMTKSPEELLTTDNICSIFNLITLLLNPFFKNSIKNEKYSDFIFNFSFFLEKVPESFYNNKLAESFIELSKTLLSLISKDNYIKMNKQYQTNILFNQKLLTKFKYEEQKMIIEQMKSVLTTVYTNKKEDELNIDIMTIINLILYYDKEKFNKFCCKEHSEYFIAQSEIMNPELSEIIKPFEEMLKLYFKKYNQDALHVIKDSKDKDSKNTNILLPSSGQDLINLFEILVIGPSPCVQKSIIKLFYEFFNSNISQANKYINLIEKDGKMFDICLFVFKSSVFEVKVDILDFIYLLLKIKKNLNQGNTSSKSKEKDKEILPSVNLTEVKEIFFNNNLLPFYLLPKEELKNIEIEKIKKQFYINGLEYNYLNKTEIEKKIFSNYNQSKMNSMLLELYSCIYKYFKDESFSLNLKFLIKLVSKGDISLIIIFLQNLENLKKEKNKFEDIYNNQELLHWLLETNFQAFMIKSTNYDQSKFISRLYFGNVEDFNTKIDLVNKLCNELLIDIFKKNIYKLDYLITWSKYFNEISKNNNKIKNELVMDFIINLLMDVDKNRLKEHMVLCDKNDIVKFNLEREGLYFMNLLFELITYFKITPVKKDTIGNIQITDSYAINEELTSKFGTILINDPKNHKFSEPLKTKWKYYDFMKKLFLYFTPIWNKLIKEEGDVYGQYMENKKNINAYIIEAELLFYSFDDANEPNIESMKKNNINKGTPIIYILYHYFTILFNLGGDKEEIKEIINTFRQFLTMLIVSSCTLSTNIDKKKRKWPKSEDYENFQFTVKNILYNSFYFFSSNIKKFDEILENNKNLSEEEKDYHLYVKNILYETFGYLLKTLNRIFRQIKKEEDKKHSKKGVKGLFSKMKGIFKDSEGIKTSGPYFLMEKLYANIGLDTNFDVKNYLDNIPHIDFRTKDVKNTTVNTKLEECIKSFHKETKLKIFFDCISTVSKDEEELNKIKLYPFLEYIQKRTVALNNFVPYYDNLQNVDYDSNDILKKLILVSDYFPIWSYEETLHKNIKEISEKLNRKLLLSIKKGDIEEKTKIHNYIKIKKQLFSFLGIWSNEEFFYNKEKYEFKYKLVNHFTEDYTRPLLKPILNLDYYLPEFTQYNYENLFRKQENKNDIYRSTDLSFIIDEHKTPLIKEEEDKKGDKKEEKKEEEKKEEEKKEENEETKHNFNCLYDIKLNYYKDLENITTNSELMKSNLSNELFIEYIKKKYLFNASQHDTEVDSCLIRSDFHITGVLFNNSKGLGFYSYDKVHKGKEEDYDKERHTCFGSIFRPQHKKYDYYYLTIPYNSIEFILRRRYFYKRNAIEIFTVNKKSYFFRIEEKKFKSFIDNIKHYMKSTIEDIYIEYSKIDDKIGIYNKQRFLSLNNGFIPLASKQQEMNIKNIYEKWTKWKISSLKMLMMINLYGSRTYHDLNQYPVFPWIITDYSSDQLPPLLNNEKEENQLIRLFGTPMGMMELSEGGKNRRENYIEHWKSGEEDTEKEDNYDRYRSHYSTSLYATYYLVRIFPYSYNRIELQGKNFDDPNRLFNSLFVSFDNATSQKADLRELIPEFFCLPELFYNINKLNLGEMGENEKKLVQDIALPPWTNNSGYNFINKHREFLESPEISEKINEWINIIFGSKQKGKEAKKIYNLFMKESYEDYEEEYKKTDLDNKIYLCKLVEFGVTPNQVFKSDTNKRISYSELKNKRQLFPNMTEYLKKINTINSDNNENDLAKELVIEETGFHIFGVPYKLSYCDLNKDKQRVYAVTQDKIKSFKKISEKIQVKKTVPVLGVTQNAAQSTNINDNKENENKEEGKDKDIIKINLEQKREIKLNLPRYRIDNEQAPMIFYNEGKNVALGGYYNGNILVQNLDENIDEKKTKVKLTTVHPTNESSPIVKMAINNADNFVICGNTLGTIYIFIINQNNKSEWTLYKTLYDHQSEIISLAINENLNVFISCSKDGYCMVYTLPDCHLINSFRLTENSFTNEVKDNNIIYSPNVTIISHNPLPCIIFYIDIRQSLSLFSINGHFIKEEKLEYKICQNGIKKYTDMQFKDYLLIYNSNNNCIDVYNIFELKSVLSLPVIGHGFVDFILSNNLDYILILVRYKGKNEEKNNEQISIKTTYKILVMRNPNCEIDWK